MFCWLSMKCRRVLLNSVVGWHIVNPVSTTSCSSFWTEPWSDSVTVSSLLLQTRGQTPGCWSIPQFPWLSSSFSTSVWSGLDPAWWNTGSPSTSKPSSLFTTSPWSACRPTCSMRCVWALILSRGSESITGTVSVLAVPWPEFTGFFLCVSLCVHISTVPDHVLALQLQLPLSACGL